MKMLTVIRSKNSGKTTTVECVVSGFTRKGFRVGSIKQIAVLCVLVVPHVAGLSVHINSV
jgi:hypothetical protein